VTGQVAKHLTKLFDSMAKLRFRQENEQDTKIALYMSSKDGEEVKLAKPCDCDGQVSEASCCEQVRPVRTGETPMRSDWSIGANSTDRSDAYWSHLLDHTGRSLHYKLDRMTLKICV